MFRCGQRRQNAGLASEGASERGEDGVRVALAGVDGAWRNERFAFEQLERDIEAASDALVTDATAARE